jgi:diphosphomevalonate decarboxylase
MSELRATARAGSNIAFIKYWGKTDYTLNLPLNDSISMTLSEAVTTTTVAWDEHLDHDEVYFDGERITDARADRISRHLDRVRTHWYRMGARVATRSSFPYGTGVASSASGFAALSTAAIAAFGEGMPDERELTRWARLGSGSASRSIHGGFVRWRAGSDEDSCAEQLAGPDHWDLRDLVVLISADPKDIPSSVGHRMAAAHAFMARRQEVLPERLLACSQAIARRDFETFAALVEQEALEVQGIMMSGTPSALYPVGLTVDLIHALRSWRAEGLPVCFTLDAGPNLHVLCEGSHAAEVEARIAAAVPRLEILHNRPGPGVRLISEHLL